MAALVTPYSVGNQAAMIRRAFTPQSMAGLQGVGLGEGSGITTKIIDAVSSFVGQRWGTQRGTITMDAQGNIVQKQAAGYPIQTAAPIYGSAAVQGPEGFATGIATGTLVAVGIGAVVLIVLMTKGRR